MTLELKKGDPWPFRSSRGIVGMPCEPQWFGLITAPQQEAKRAHQLENAGCEVQYPSWERTRHVAGKKHTQEVPVIPRIIYAKFNFEPQWDVLKARKIIVGVFSDRGRPIVLRDDDIARVMGLPTEADKLANAEREASRPKVGGKAQILSGPFADFYVDVTRVEFGRVWWEMTCGIKGEAPENVMRAAG